MVEWGLMNITKVKINSFRRMIFRWWATHRRDLPWRDTDDPYNILISEVMLQQTQVRRVIPKYDEFLYFFPDVYALAHASPARILKAWKGMGYNRRALYLKKTAEVIIGKYHGEFPKSESDLVKLPGLGKYTARAIMVFAFRKNIAMVDTNIRKIITHFFFKDLPQKEKDVQSVADALMPKGKSWEWHQALMDYGAQMRQPRAKSRGGRKKAVPFKDSNRFYRGKIIDLLRIQSWQEKRLVDHVMGTYYKPRLDVAEIISGLVKDGLIERKKGTVLLPQ